MACNNPRRTASWNGQTGSFSFRQQLGLDYNNDDLTVVRIELVDVQPAPGSGDPFDPEPAWLTQGFAEQLLHGSQASRLYATFDIRASDLEPGRIYTVEYELNTGAVGSFCIETGVLPEPDPIAPYSHVIYTQASRYVYRENVPNGDGKTLLYDYGVSGSLFLAPRSRSGYVYVYRSAANPAWLDRINLETLAFEPVRQLPRFGNDLSVDHDAQIIAYRTQNGADTYRGTFAGDSDVLLTGIDWASPYVCPEEQAIYYAYFSGGNLVLRKQAYTGEDSEVWSIPLSGTKLSSLRIDPTNGYVFLKENGVFRRRNLLDGSGAVDLITGQTSTPHNETLDFDPVSQQVYAYLVANEVVRYNYDGSNPTSIEVGLSSGATVSLAVV